MNHMIDTILSVFSRTGFEGSVCSWYLDYVPEVYDPIFTIEFKPAEKLHVIQGIVPVDIALEAVKVLEEIGYTMVKLDGSTVQ